MRKGTYALNCAIICVLCFLYSAHSHALMENTHGAINEYIAKSTVMEFSLNQYLQRDLNWNAGILTDVGGKKVWE